MDMTSRSTDTPSSTDSSLNDVAFDEPVKLDDLLKELQLVHRTFNEQLSLIRRDFEETIRIIREESAAWRESSEDEFCRLISTCTRHLTTLQEKYQRAVRNESLLSQKLTKVTAEKEALKEEVISDP